MATIIIRNSTGSGAVPSSLVQGELAINTVDGKLFYGSGSGNVVKEFTANSSSFATSASYATQAGNAAAIDIYSFSSPVESYLLMSNVVGTTGVAVGGDADLRYNSSTNVLTVGSVSATSFTGSLIGTASWATNAITASIAEIAISALTSSTILTIRDSTNATYYPTFVDSNNAVKAAENVYTNRDFVFNPGTATFSAPIIAAPLGFTGSLTGSLLGTASYAVQALSASWAPGGGSAFPYIGTAVITGSLIVSGTNGGINTSLGFPVLFQNDGVNTVTFGNGKLWLNDSVGGTSVDWGNRYLLDTSGTTKADWEQSYLADGAAITRVDWGNGALNDSAGTAAFDWESRRMIDVAGARSADFDTRFLIYPNGTTAAINYGTQGQIAMTGSVSITGSLTVSGSSTFTNIGPAIFTGSVSSLNGFTGSLQGTASYATQALSASWAPGGATTAGAQIFGNYGGSGFTNPIVTYLPFGFTTVSGNELQRQLHVGVGGTVKNFYLRTNSTAVAGSYTTFTIRINGASSGIQIAVSGGQVANVYSDTTNTATINPGDYVSIQVSTSIANGPQLNSYGFAIE